jgi:DNA-binding transcriptional regulator YiaG
MIRTLNEPTQNGKGLEDLAQAVRLRADIPAPARCREIRKDAHVSAAELAAIVGVSEVAICSWERGTRSPSGANRERYAEALRVLRSARDAS